MSTDWFGFFSSLTSSEDRSVGTISALRRQSIKINFNARAEKLNVHNQFRLLATSMPLRVFLSIFFPLLFATLSASVYYSPPDEKPGDVECKYDLMKFLL